MGKYHSRVDNTIACIGFCHSWCEPSRNLQFTRAQFSPLSGVLFNVLADKPYTSPMGAYYNVTTLIVFGRRCFTRNTSQNSKSQRLIKTMGHCENDVAAQQDLFGNYPLTKEWGDEVRGFKDLCYYSFSNKIDPFLQGNSRCQFHKF